MSTATLTTKGQITTPVEVRNALAIDTGDRVAFVAVGPGQFLMTTTTHFLTELKGMFGKPARTVSIEGMNQAIATHGASAR